MARDHVGEKTHGEREPAHDGELKELDRGEQDVHGLRHARRHGFVFEVAEEAVLLHAAVHVGAEGPHRQQEWHADHGGAREVEARGNAGKVHREDEEEQRVEHGSEAASLCLTEDGLDRIVANEAHEELENALDAPRHNLGA